MAPVIRYFPAGKHCEDSQPGDLVLVRHKSFMASAIRWAERIRRPRNIATVDWRQYSGWNHSAIAIGDNLISEEEARGDVFTPLGMYAAEEYVVVHFPDTTPAETEHVVEFAKSIQGHGYGYVTIIADLFNALTGLELTLGWGDHMVCSTATCRALERTGLIPDRSPYAVTPAHLAAYYGVPYAGQASSSSC